MLDSWPEHSIVLEQIKNIEPHIDPQFRRLAGTVRRGCRKKLQCGRLI